MSRNNAIKILIAVGMLVAVACSCFSTPYVESPSNTTNNITPYVTDILPTPQNSICGWIDNPSTTGAWKGTLTVSGTGEVIQLWYLEMSAWDMLQAITVPGYARVYDPIYESPGSMMTFSMIEQVSTCP